MVWSNWEEDFGPYFEREPIVRKSHPIFDPEQFWDYVNQTKIWINKEQQEFRIKQLEKQYLFNILKWADNHSEEIYYTFVTAQQIGKIPSDVSWFSGVGFESNVEHLPLFARIKKRYFKLVGAPTKEEVGV